MQDDAWIILDNKVYDVTPVLSWHPGQTRRCLTNVLCLTHPMFLFRRPAVHPHVCRQGFYRAFNRGSSLVQYSETRVDSIGIASTRAFTTTVSVQRLTFSTTTHVPIGSTVAHGKRDECLLGVLSAEAIKVMEQDAARAAKELQELKEARKGLALQPDAFTAAQLVKRADISHDSRYEPGISASLNRAHRAAACHQAIYVRASSPARRQSGKAWPSRGTTCFDLAAL